MNERPINIDANAVEAAKAFMVMAEGRSLSGEISMDKYGNWYSGICTINDQVSGLIDKEVDTRIISEMVASIFHMLALKDKAYKYMVDNYKEIATAPFPPLKKFAFHDDDYFESKAKRGWTIQGLLQDRCSVMVYGKPASGKSLLTLDWAMCVSTGLSWNDRKVQQGRVVYIVAEGAAGMGARIRSWKKKTGWRGSTDVWWIENPVALNSPADVALLMAEVKGQIGDEKVDVIVFDTFARCTTGVDENSSKEVGVVIGSLDGIRAEFDCSVWVVHHDGKVGNGPRGSQRLTGDFDIVVNVEKKDLDRSVVKCEKPKDFNPFPNFDIIINRIQFSDDEYDTGAYIEPTDEGRPEKKLSNEDKAYDILRKSSTGKVFLTNSEWMIQCRQAGVLESSFKAIPRKLKEQGLIEKCNHDGKPNEIGKYYRHAVSSEADLYENVPLQPIQLEGE